MKISLISQLIVFGALAAVLSGCGNSAPEGPAPVPAGNVVADKPVPTLAPSP